MENASKALIIAGAILLSILIIALGVFIFQKAQGAMGDVGLDEQKIASVNQKYEAYEGENKSGSDVRALIDLVRTNNNTYDASEKRTISINDKSAAADLATYKNTIKPGNTYTITITSYYGSGATKGLVEKITIK